MVHLVQLQELVVLVVVAMEMVILLQELLVKVMLEVVVLKVEIKELVVEAEELLRLGLLVLHLMVMVGEMEEQVFLFL